MQFSQALSPLKVPGSQELTQEPDGSVGPGSPSSQRGGGQ